MSKVAKFLRLRLGAKTHILLGLILALLGLRFAWSLVRALAMSPGSVPAGHHALIGAIVLLFLAGRGLRIYSGLRAGRKHWLEEPLGKN